MRVNIWRATPIYVYIYRTVHPFAPAPDTLMSYVYMDRWIARWIDGYICM